MNLNYLLILFVVFTFQLTNAQELQATVSVNAERMTDANPAVFKNLQTKATEFLNNTKFTSTEYKPEERIVCNFYINVSEYNNNIVTADLQIQSSRPIYNSTYLSPILNINDKNFNFQFLEYEQLVYDENSFTSNLVAVLAYYANIIIATDSDSFKELSGTTALEKAFAITNLAQSTNYKGWKQNERNNNNRHFLISDLLSNTYQPYRQTLYEYHLLGLDKMSNDTKTAKNEIAKSITTLAKIHKSRPNSLVMRTFFDAKTDEIKAIFSGGPYYNTVQLKENLAKISPLNSSKWNAIP